ncbi:hypothetical protein ElyMa_003120900 [Elysia marginata]|uniref:PiggyBac transposable element-derived protein 4 C-terminal zinc-finger domain-containing protein n=1 Tax=Elysia marginata TaxID=1093978 RepID=A0AAV4ISR3_9GAST|nr:hypothetical protein ElyMa_003120900 [Elysia marginata]
MWDSWRENAPAGSRYGRSKNGWMDSHDFLEWFRVHDHCCALGEEEGRTDEDRERKDARQPGRPSTTIIERFTGNKHLIRHTPDDRMCEYCSKGTGNRKRTNFYCIGCSSHPYLNPKNCFEQYHLESNIQL